MRLRIDAVRLGGTICPVDGELGGRVEGALPCSAQKSVAMPLISQSP
jgi:hypothetical protein